MVGGNCERDPSSPKLPWPTRPSLELTEQKRKGTRVVTLTIRERGGVRKVGHTTMASAEKSSLRGAVIFKEKLIRLNGYPKPYPMVFHVSIVRWWPPSGGLYSELTSSMTPAHNRQGLTLSEVSYGAVCTAYRLAILSRYMQGV